jgi:putative cell wall-binding protein
VYLVTGTNFPDAVSAANAAVVEGGPVLLTSPTSLPPATASELARLAPTTVVIVGGTSSVSSAVEASVRTLFGGTIVRLSGPDRYATAVAVSQRAFAGGASGPFLATGTSFPDALAGGPVAAELGAPLLLVQASCSPASVTAEIDRLGATKLVLLGGTAVLSDSLANLPAC